ncbi:MAG: phosphoglucosamine mutase, partial [Pseudolysinimonas sp.]
IDGDQMMAILAVSLKQRGLLARDTLVATVMSNLGLRRAMAEHGIRMIETKVGDRYVLEQLDGQELSLGGEQSGHIIFRDHATTGDGILTGLQLAAEMARTGKTLTELAAVMTVYPQVLVNVSGVDQHGLAADSGVADAVRAAEARLGDTGRVLLRPSGTEPLVRVMVEAADHDVAAAIAEQLAAVVRDRLTITA